MSSDVSLSPPFSPSPPPPLLSPPTTNAQVYKTTADSEAGCSLYERYSAVSEEGGWLGLREVVLARKMPRRMLVQPLTQLEEGTVHVYTCISVHAVGSRVFIIGCK